ncbi:uncharacterized protein [Nicotiana tomentosiformis]|uniref:uncharacterized protein n=1 Tax=Nicotiana tomentosiformis TaxID=4098 RepID=UPI00388CAE6B
MDVLTQHIQGKVLWCMLFTDDIVLIDEMWAGVSARLEVWRRTFESKGFKLNITKMGYLECKVSGMTKEEDVEVRLDSQVIPKKGSFKYLRSIISSNGEIDEDVTHHIETGYMK